LLIERIDLNLYSAKSAINNQQSEIPLTPLAIIFLTIFVNLVGFGIIIPLLPFYAQTFGASPIAIGLLFASFSLSQLAASPILGGLSDR